MITEVYQEIADLLASPRSIRMSGDPEDVDVAGADFDDEQAVQAPECHGGVHVEEVGGEDGRGLGLQELPPGRVGVPHWRWRDPQSLEYPADGGGAGPVAELEQLALDALVSPAVVLGGEPLDERRDLSTDRWASGPVRVGPFLSHQATMPSQDGAGRDQPVCLQPLGSCRISAASTARSAQSSRGRGLRRRRTATSCRSTSSSAFLDAGDRPSRTSQLQSRTKIR